MRNLVAMIAAVLSAMPKMVMRRVLEAGAWVERLFMEPSQPQPIAEPVSVTAEPAVDDFGALKRLAKSMLGNVEPNANDFLQVSDLSVSWLATLDRISLSKVALASDEALRGHIRGGQPMRGIVPHDPAAIEDIKRSRRSPEAVERRQRTRRDIAELAGIPLPA